MAVRRPNLSPSHDGVGAMGGAFLKKDLGRRGSERLARVEAKRMGNAVCESLNPHRALDGFRFPLLEPRAEPHDGAPMWARCGL